MADPLSSRILTSAEVSTMANALRIAAGCWEGEASAPGTSTELAQRFRAWASEARQHAQLLESASSVTLSEVAHG